MPEVVILQVNTLAADQPHLLTFYDRHKCEIGDADDVLANPETTDHYEMPGVIGDNVPIPGVDEDNTKELVEGPSEMNQIIMPSPPPQSNTSLIELLHDTTNFQPTSPEDLDTQAFESSQYERVTCGTTQ